MVIDPIAAATIGLMIAREIRQAREAGKEYTEEELAKRITDNLLAIYRITETIKQEMKGG